MKEDILKIPDTLHLFPFVLCGEGLAADLSLFLAQRCDYGKRTDIRVKSSALEVRYRLSGTEIRRAIRFARRKGVFIVGTPTGYYYGSESVDGNRIKDDLIGRIKSMGKTLSLMAKRSGYKFQLDLSFERDGVTTAYTLDDDG